MWINPDSDDRLIKKLAKGWSGGYDLGGKVARAKLFSPGYLRAESDGVRAFVSNDCRIAD